MKRLRFEHIIIIVLVLVSILFYVLQEVIFHNPEESSYLFFQDLAFLPLNIVLVTFVLEQVLRSREKRERLEQLNILVSTFFTDTGTAILETMQSCMDTQRSFELDMNAKWTDKMFDDTAETARKAAWHARPDADTLGRLKDFLPQKKAGILAMFSNPNLLENDRFTDMLWALYHLIDELESRNDISALPQSDTAHLGGDMARAFGLLVSEWVGYMKYLKKRYPYLWSLAIRKNPFDQNSIIISEPA
jgi:hypothetical protein